MTEYLEEEGSSASSQKTTTSPTTHSPEPSKEEYEKWLAEATIYKSQAEDFLSPEKEQKKEEEERKPQPEADRTGRAKPLMRQTTIKGESNEFATKPAIDPETSKPVRTFLYPSTSDLASLNESSVATLTNPSVMSADKLRDHNLFELKASHLSKQLTPNFVTSKNESLMRVAKDDDTPENSPITEKAKPATHHARARPSPPQLYKMSWPVIPNAHEMEKFEKVRERAYGISALNVDTFVRNVAAADFATISNAINTSFFATRFARRRTGTARCRERR